MFYCCVAARQRRLKAPTARSRSLGNLHLNGATPESNPPFSPPRGPPGSLLGAAEGPQTPLWERSVRALRLQSAVMMLVCSAVCKSRRHYGCHRSHWRQSRPSLTPPPWRHTPPPQPLHRRRIYKRWPAQSDCRGDKSSFKPIRPIFNCNLWRWKQQNVASHQVRQKVLSSRALKLEDFKGGGGATPVTVCANSRMQQNGIGPFANFVSHLR